jgi:phosphoribosylformylglycinamidine synthase
MVIPGGFSAGDEPEGSGKYINAFFRNAALIDGIHNLLEKRDGLILGICNGFQALIKLGLIPNGRITTVSEFSPTLTFNTIGRHQSGIVRTRVCSTLSPWFAGCGVGDIYSVPISHGEGRFVASAGVMQNLIANGQIASQYVNMEGEPVMDSNYNPNGSVCAVEAVTSPDGRVMGKMGHTERYSRGIYKNVPGNYEMKLFESAKNYFT